MCITEKKGKFLSFLKAKAKPVQPRKPKTTYELKATLKTFKRQKTEQILGKTHSVDMYGNVTPVEIKGPQMPDAVMAPAPQVDNLKKKK